MKKLSFLLAMALFFTGGVRASVIPPVDARGNSLYSTEFVGALATSIDASTGTAAVIINSTGTFGISMGPAIVYAVITSSINQGDYIVFKDTTGIGDTGVMLSTKMAGLSLTTAAVVGNQWQVAVTSGLAQWPYPTVNMFKFPVPIQFTSGILAQVSAAPLSNQGVSRWTILWRPVYTGKSSNAGVNFTPPSAN